MCMCVLCVRARVCVIPLITPFLSEPINCKFPYVLLFRKIMCNQQLLSTHLCVYVRVTSCVLQFLSNKRQI